jgi:hypothetical protein
MNYKALPLSQLNTIGTRLHYYCEIQHFSTINVLGKEIIIRIIQGELGS